MSPLLLVHSSKACSNLGRMRLKVRSQKLSPLWVAGIQVIEASPAPCHGPRKHGLDCKLESGLEPEMCRYKSTGTAMPHFSPDSVHGIFFTTVMLVLKIRRIKRFQSIFQFCSFYYSFIIIVIPNAEHPIA